mmetsp:Transcript_35845/g.87086  ORF Transcript_35845/g.87086 Transcript_35845/m.87086 type:complete len:231 (-) Transcript_35845:554-1246(-)
MVRAAACNRACLPDACADAPRRAVHRARRRTRRDGTPPGFRRDGHARAAVLPRRACRGGHARRRARSRAGRCVRALVRTMHLARRGVDRDPGDLRERGPPRLRGVLQAARRDVRGGEHPHRDRRGRAERAHCDRRRGLLRLQGTAEHRTAGKCEGAREDNFLRVLLARARDAAGIAHPDHGGSVLELFQAAARGAPGVGEDDRRIRVQIVRGIAECGVPGIPGDDRQECV